MKNTDNLLLSTLGIFCAVLGLIGVWIFGKSMGTALDKILSEETLKQLLLEHYTFLKRPVLIYDKILFIGNSAAVVEKAKTFLDEQ